MRAACHRPADLQIAYRERHPPADHRDTPLFQAL